MMLFVSAMAIMAALRMVSKTNIVPIESIEGGWRKLLTEMDLDVQRRLYFPFFTLISNKSSQKGDQRDPD